MGTGLFIILIIIAIIILFVIIIIIFKVSSDALNSQISIEIGDFCNATSNCPLGLQCDSGRCRIPTGGSCVLFPNLCANGNVCFKGRCIPSLTGNIVSSNINLPIIDKSISRNNNSTFKSIRLINDSNDNTNILVFQGAINSASTSATSSDLALSTGIWIAGPDKNNTDKIMYINDNGKIYSYPLNKEILDCKSFENVCFILCADSTLYLASFNDINIQVEQITFPTNDDSVNSSPISLGRSMVNTLMITMTDGIWIADLNGMWSWIPIDNSNVLHTTFINNKRLTVYSNNSYTYGSIAGNWSSNAWPYISNDNNAQPKSQNFWISDILALE
jgi:hypothetical protein